MPVTRPYTLALLLAEDARTNDKGQVSLFRLVIGLRAPRFPCAVNLVIHSQVSGIDGGADIVATVAKLGHAHEPGRGAVHARTFAIRGVTVDAINTLTWLAQLEFPVAGLYAVDLHCRGELIGTRHFEVEHAHAIAPVG